MRRMRVLEGRGGRTGEHTLSSSRAVRGLDKALLTFCPYLVIPAARAISLVRFQMTRTTRVVECADERYSAFVPIFFCTESIVESFLCASGRDTGVPSINR
jgi:hypothetical protein